MIHFLSRNRQIKRPGKSPASSNLKMGAQGFLFS
jgi:hypothetical protein